MKLLDFDYSLPDELIARYPLKSRSDSRLLVVDRATNSLVDKQFSDILSYFDQNCTLVLNETKVIPARLEGIRKTGGKVEIFLVHRQADRTDTWHVLAAPAKKVRTGDVITINEGLSCEVIEELGAGERIVQFFLQPGIGSSGSQPETPSARAKSPSYQSSIEDAIEAAGAMPIPPYLRRDAEEIDKERYQTVFAKVPGAVAAPTASLHFTEGMLAALEAKGVKIARVVLHVGLGTFKPVEVEDIRDHKMHAEYYSVSQEAADTINESRREGKKIIAVGTTAARTLETAADENGIIHPGSGETSIFIYPPYKFKAVDALLTNFHQPRSTLLMMISAFAGYDLVMKAYEHAINERYRFLSYGDAMLII